MIALLAVCLLAVSVTAQAPRPCQSPKQWEGRVFTVDRSKQFERYGKISYDEYAPRFRIIEEEREGSTEEFYDRLYLHNVGKEYSLNLKTRKCNVTSLTRPFRPFGVPPEAKFTGEATIGAAGVPGESVVIENFDGEFSDGDKFFGDVTYPDCVPVANGVFSKEFGFVMNSFFDINVGIADPMVFVPPPECAGPVTGSFRTVNVLVFSLFLFFCFFHYSKRKEGISNMNRLQFPQLGKEYSLNIRTRQCNVTNLTRPFRPYGVPPFANFSGEASIGATGVPGESVVIEHFTGKFEDGTYFFGDVTYPDCFPVNRGAFNNEMGFVMETFFDINIGIADPSVFIPPSECAGR
ncbi:hypothetical protein FSP39_002199 [Pinctada imbricata]|uniref:Uncharacterized protein n=1 Tax=Pinctada imbricata TaxID=66713 RepID=A0AA88XTZ5_PINIB|nr:hypothetical protein FSP39_002199 [Pinctada imbricata]